jgi:hypothetical protein
MKQKENSPCSLEKYKMGHVSGANPAHPQLLHPLVLTLLYILYSKPSYLGST